MADSDERTPADRIEATRRAARSLVDHVNQLLQQQILRKAQLESGSS